MTPQSRRAGKKSLRMRMVATGCRRLVVRRTVHPRQRGSAGVKHWEAGSPGVLRGVACWRAVRIHPKERTHPAAHKHQTRLRSWRIPAAPPPPRPPRPLFPKVWTRGRWWPWLLSWTYSARTKSLSLNSNGILPSKSFAVPTRNLGQQKGGAQSRTCLVSQYPWSAACCVESDLWAGA